jgi:hypothetical protein
LDVAWLRRYIPASMLPEYERAIAPAAAKYVRVWAPARAGCDRGRVIGAALMEYERVRDAALLAALSKEG